MLVLSNARLNASAKGIVQRCAGGPLVRCCTGLGAEWEIVQNGGTRAEKRVSLFLRFSWIEVKYMWWWLREKE